MIAMSVLLYDPHSLSYRETRELFEDFIEVTTSITWFHYFYKMTLRIIFTDPCDDDTEALKQELNDTKEELNDTKEELNDTKEDLAKMKELAEVSCTGVGIYSVPGTHNTLNYI